MRDRADVLRLFASGIEVAQKQPVADWVAENVILPRSVSSKPGPLRLNTAQRQIIDAIETPGIDRIVCMFSAQCGKTALVTAYLSYRLATDPTNLLAVFPSQSAGEIYSETVLGPIIQASDALSSKIGADKRGARGGAAGDAKRVKTFPGGSLTIASASTPAELASKSCEVIMADEIDRFGASSGAEGDPVLLAAKRSSSFANPKLVCISTPTIEGSSRIESLYKSGSQSRFHVTCPDCGASQEPVFENIKWKRGNYDDVHLACAECGSLWDEATRQRLLRSGKFIPTNPDAEPGVLSFALSEVASQFSTLGRIAQQYDRAQGSPHTERTFINTVLGRPYPLTGRSVDEEGLISRLEYLPLDRLPRDIVGTVVTGDVQIDRIELVRVGFNKTKDRLWILEHFVSYGDPAASNIPWQGCFPFLMKTVQTEDGRRLRPAGAAIDAGFQTSRVLEFVAAIRRQAGVPAIALKGQAGWGRPLLKAASNKRGLWIVGVDDSRAAALQMLSVRDREAQGFVHLADTLTADFVSQLASESLVTHIVGGQPKLRWEKRAAHVRSEAWDLLVYALAIIKGGLS